VSYEIKPGGPNHIMPDEGQGTPATFAYDPLVVDVVSFNLLPLLFRTGASNALVFDLLMNILAGLAEVYPEVLTRNVA
jgi:hypothetical protein